MTGTPRMALVPVEAALNTPFGAETLAASPNAGKVSREQLEKATKAVQEWLDYCWENKEEFDAYSGAYHAIRALGLEIAEPD